MAAQKLETMHLSMVTEHNFKNQPSFYILQQTIQK